jgi:hypothetical protein
MNDVSSSVPASVDTTRTAWSSSPVLLDPISTLVMLSAPDWTGLPLGSPKPDTAWTTQFTRLRAAQGQQRARGGRVGGQLLGGNRLEPPLKRRAGVRDQLHTGSTACPQRRGGCQQRGKTDRIDSATAAKVDGDSRYRSLDCVREHSAPPRDSVIFQIPLDV